jgi:glyoxylase-like metal-dependent hydrolase (beta-lactamase superfamily II)
MGINQTTGGTGLRGVVCCLFIVMIFVGTTQSAEATNSEYVGHDGFFRLHKTNHWWWLVDPKDGEMVSLGINHVAPHFLLSNDYRAAHIETYGDDLVTAKGLPNLRGEAVKDFQAASIELVRSWGFNTLGKHNPLPQSEMPWLASFRPAPIDGWRGNKKNYPDPFDPETERLVDAKAREWAQTHGQDRLIIGIAMNDMPRWRSSPQQIHPWVRKLMARYTGTPGKRAWVEFLKTRYPNPQAAAKVYGCEASTWEDLERKSKWGRPNDPRQAFRDELAFLPLVADRWYGLTTEALRRHAPNHLIFGDKIIVPEDLPEWLEPIVKRHFDVLCLQWFGHAGDQIEMLESLHLRTGKPILMADSSFAHPNERVPNPKGFPVSSQEEVGEAYYRYLKAVISKPYVLGWHHCGFMEGSPELATFHALAARQNGFLRPDGSVYEKTIERVTEANSRAFAWHAGNALTTVVTSLQNEMAEPPASNLEGLKSTAPKKEPGTPTHGERGVVAGSSVVTDPHRQRCRSDKRKGYVLTEIDHNVFELRAKKGRRGAKGLAMKPVSWIVTGEGVVVIDPGAPRSAALAKKAIRELTDQPIKYIIYTHHHMTQLRGASVLMEDDTEIIAHEDLILELDLRQRLDEYYDRLNKIQFDMSASPSTTVPYPNITYADRTSLELGGTVVDLRHVVGEADDYTVVFLPEQKIVWTADLAGSGMPMLASPMKRVRNEVKWKLALEEVLSLEPEVLLRSVGPPICDPIKIEANLGVLIEFFDFIHIAVTDELNRGSSVEEAVSRIKLPATLETSGYLEERYGTLEFAVRGLYHRYSGWFDQNGSHIRPAPRLPSSISTC